MSDHQPFLGGTAAPHLDLQFPEELSKPGHSSDAKGRTSVGVSIVMGVPNNRWLIREVPFKWMIWGYPISRNHHYHVVATCKVENSIGRSTTNHKNKPYDVRICKTPAIVGV